MILPSSNYDDLYKRKIRLALDLTHGYGIVGLMLGLRICGVLNMFLLYIGCWFFAAFCAEFDV